MWRSLSFMLYVGSISALDFPQIGFVLCWHQKGLQGVGGALEHAVLSFEIAAGACWALESAVPSLEIAAPACSEPHVRSKSQLGPVPEPRCLGPLAADMFLYVV